MKILKPLFEQKYGYVLRELHLKSKITVTNKQDYDRIKTFLSRGEYPRGYQIRHGVKISTRQISPVKWEIEAKKANPKEDTINVAKWDEVDPYVRQQVMEELITQGL